MKQLNLLFWIPTALFSLAMLGGGIGDLLHAEPLMESLQGLGYPAYLATLLGFWKVLGVGALVLAPKTWIRLKQWAYAGFFFDLSGAAFSHIASGDGIAEVAPVMVFLTLGFFSWMMLPSSRKTTVGEASLQPQPAS